MQERWNNRFQADKSVYGKIPNQFFADELELLAPGSILLPGEGQGRNAVFAAKLGWDVRALDFSEVARKQALAFAAEEEVALTYDLMSFEQMDLPKDTYDAAGLILAHTLPQFRPLVHKKVAAALKPGGFLILEGFHKKQLGRTSGGPKRIDMLFNEAELTEDFSDLEILNLKVKTVELDEGNFHQGEAVIIRLLAKKWQTDAAKG